MIYAEEQTEELSLYDYWSADTGMLTEYRA